MNADSNVDKTKSALAIQCIPMGEKYREKSWAVVDKVIQVIEKSGLNYTVSPFETVVEGPLGKLLELIADAHRTLVASGTGTAATYIKLWSGEAIGSSAEKTGKHRNH